jgi:phosphate transport system substrate-binding protein
MGVFMKSMVLALLITASMTLGGCSASASVSSGFDNSKDINVTSREDGSGTRGAFIELFGIEEKRDDGSRSDRTTKDAVIANRTDVMMTGVANDTFSIGYISLGSLNDTVKAVQIDGVDASVENIKNAKYSISRPFFIATKGEPSGLASDFINFIMSAEGQAVVGADYIAIEEASASFVGKKPEGKIVVAGSSSVTPIMEKLKEAYLALNTNANIEIQQTDSTAGMTAAIEGTCDIGMASRSLKDSELETLMPMQIAIDGLAVIVNKANPTTSLSSDQVRGIYVGEITKWSELQ